MHARVLRWSCDSKQLCTCHHASCDFICKPVKCACKCHAQVHRYSELFQNTVNNEIGINLNQHASLTEIMLVKTDVRQTTCSYTLPYPLPLLNVDEFLQTLPYCEASYCSLKINLKWLVTCFMFYAANLMLLYTTVVKNLFSRMIECWYDKNQFISSLKQLFVYVYCQSSYSVSAMHSWYVYIQGFNWSLR